MTPEDLISKSPLPRRFDVLASLLLAHITNGVQMVMTSWPTLGF